MTGTPSVDDERFDAYPPVDPALRKARWEAAKPITIGDNVWLGGGVVGCPGVTIGANTVVGAGAVVARDLPPNVVAVGNPAGVRQGPRRPRERPVGTGLAHHADTQLDPDLDAELRRD